MAGHKQQPGGAQPLAQPVHCGAVVAAAEQLLPPGPGGHADKQVPGQNGQLPQQGPHVPPPGVQPVQVRQSLPGVPAEDALHQLRRLYVPRQSQHVQHPAAVDGPAAAGALVQQAQRVPQRPVGQAGQQLRRLRQQLQPLPLGHVQQPCADVLGPDALEGEPLAPGEDGGGHLVELRGGQDEDEVRRGLLQNLQQGVEGRCGEHVDLIYNVHPVLDAGRRVDGLVPQGADVVHAVVGRRVQLQHVQQAAAVDPLTGGALAAGIPVRGVEAVDGLGQNLGAGGLAGAPGAGEEVGVAQPPLLHLPAQGAGDVLLSHHVLEGPGPPLAV